METILITGGGGLVGRYLCKKLQEKGHNVSVLSTAKRYYTNVHSYTWDLDKKEIEKGAIETADYIIHLAGANIGEKRWTAKRRKLILDSRVKTGELIFDKIKENRNKLRAFISASAIGYYGSITSDKIFCETDPPSLDFLGETCRQWEKSADRFEELEIRTVKIRTGVLLTKQGGVLAKMIVPVKMGIGSALGKGNQYLPWIHIDDLCGIYIKAIEDAKMNGAYNAVAPDHKTNKEFIKTLSGVLNKPFWFPDIPSILMKIFFGRLSEMLTEGSRVSSDKIRKEGYNFHFPDLESALTDLVGKK